MTKLTKAQQKAKMASMLNDAQTSDTKPPFFYPNKGMDGHADFKYLIRINDYESITWKHVVNGNYVKCHESDCIYCRDGTRRVRSMMLEIEVLEDPRMNAYSQIGMCLRWEIKSELIRIFQQALTSGVRIFDHPFRLLVLKKKACDKPHYQLSRFITNQVFDDVAQSEDNDESDTGESVVDPIKIQDDAGAPAPAAIPDIVRPDVITITDDEISEADKNLVFTEEDFKL